MHNTKVLFVFVFFILHLTGYLTGLLWHALGSLVRHPDPSIRFVVSYCAHITCLWYLQRFTRWNVAEKAMIFLVFAMIMYPPIYNIDPGTAVQCAC
jgi:hypothetical protein